MDVFLEPIHFGLHLPENLLYPVPKKLARMSNWYLKYFVLVITFLGLYRCFNNLFYVQTTQNCTYFSKFVYKNFGYHNTTFYGKRTFT